MFLTGDAMQWHKLTLTFEGPELAETPETFTDYRLDVTFTHESGETVTVPGYFAADGQAADSGATEGTVWRAHFNPPKTGEWTWNAEFRTGDDIAVSTASGNSAGYFDGDSGAFDVAASDKTGDDLRAKGVLEYDGGQYLSFAGTDEVFLKSGVGSPENFLAFSGFDDTPLSHDYAAHVDDFNAGDPTWSGNEGQGIIGAVNYLAEHDVNSVYMMLMNIGGDGRDVSPWADTSLYAIKKNPGHVDLDERAQVFDVSKLDQWEILFGHMQEKGLNLHLFLQETENDQLLNNGELGLERKLFMREMVARFSHHNGVIWNLGEENTNTTDQITDHSAYLKSLDPYDHAVTLHTYPGQHGKYEDYEGTETLDGLSFQTSNDSQVPDLDRYLGGAEDAGRPVVAFLDEPGNATIGLAAEGDSGWQANHDNMRETLWKFYAEGGSGAEWYFGYQSAGGQGGDLEMEDFSLRESAYEWAASAREFFEKLPLEDMRDGDGLTSGTETHGLALDDQVYAYYLPDGGQALLNLSAASGEFQVGWYDVVEGGALQVGSVDTVSGGGSRSLGLPPSQTGGEWAVLVWDPSKYSFDVADGGGTGDGGGTPTPPPVDDDDTGSADDHGVTFRLVDTATDRTIGTLADGDTLDPSLIGSKTVSIVADVDGSVGSVRFTLGNWSQTENVAPYALFGDTNGDYKSAPNAPFGEEGDYTLKTELFSGQKASGKIGEVLTTFTVGEATDDPDEGNDGGGDVTPPPTSDATWLAQDGLVVMQAEKGVPTDEDNSGNGNWKIEDDLGGHTGEGYLHWDGPNHYGSPGQGALSYEFEVTEEGNYKLGLLGSRPKNGEASDLNNDFWVRVDGGAWKKVFYSGARETWNWGKTFDVNHQKSTAAYDLEEGVHTLEISGRSEDAYLDKIHLSLGSLNTDKSAPETLAPEGPVDEPDPVPDLAPVAGDTGVTVDEDGQVTIAASDLASHPEGGALTVRIVSGPSHGSLTAKNAAELVYTPADDYAGADAAVVEVLDAAGNATELTLDLTVDPVNDAPVADDDAGGTVEAGQGFELTNLLANDGDIDGDALSILSLAPVTPGFFEALDVSPDGTVTGTLAGDATGDGVFEYTVTDGNGGTDTGLVTITAETPEDVEKPEDPVDPACEDDAPVEEQDPTDLWLVDTASDEQLVRMGEHTIVHGSLADGRPLSVSAEVDEAELDVESARLHLDGKAVRTENVEPYALFGDLERNFLGGLKLEEGDTHEVEVDYYAGNKAKGALLHSDEATLVYGGEVMTGREGEADTFAFDSEELGAARIVGFEEHDTLAGLGRDGEDLTKLGAQVDDDWVIDFGDGNVLTLEDYASTQIEKEAREDEELVCVLHG